MPAIRLIDNSGLEMSVAPSSASSFTKYLKSERPIEAVLAGDPFQSGGAQLWFKVPFVFTSGGVHLTVNPEMPGDIAIAKDGFLFEAADDSFGDRIPVPPGQAYVSLRIRALIGEGGSDQSQIAITNYRLLPLPALSPPAIGELLQTFIIPGDLADIQSLPEGSIATVEGRSSLKVTAEADIPLGVNPLATVSNTFLGGALCAKAGGSVGIKAAYTLTGDYQTRIQRIAGRKFQLGFEKAHSSEFDVSVEAQAGTSITADGTDLIEALVKAASADPAADDAILTTDQKSSIQAALKAGIERSLQLSVTAELDLLHGDSPAFSYEIDPDALEAEGTQALIDALRGDLTSLATAPLAGVKPMRSILLNMHRKQSVLRLNLLGIFNFGSIASLLRNGAVIVDRDTGFITITDQTTATRVGFASDNFAKNSARLRKTLADSLMITAAYRTGAGISSQEFGASHWCYELHERTGVKDVQHYLNIARALGIPAPAGKAVPTSFGRSQFLIDLQYTDALFRNLFLDRANEARPRQEYEAVARTAMLALLPAGDPLTDARRLPLTKADLWEQMKEQGQPNDFGGVLEPYHFGPNQLGDIAADYALIRWWADAMHKMAVALEAILKNPNDSTSAQLRSALNRAAASVEENTENEFAEPFGLLAMDLASGQRAAVDLHMGSPNFSFAGSRNHSLI